jgi:hypothetical protein
MDKPDITITDRQLKVYEALQKIKMAWVALWAALILFTLVLLAFLYALFFVPGQETSKTLMAGVDGTLGWALRTVYAYLFPSQRARSK